MIRDTKKTKTTRTEIQGEREGKRRVRLSHYKHPEFPKSLSNDGHLSAQAGEGGRRGDKKTVIYGKSLDDDASVPNRTGTVTRCSGEKISRIFFVQMRQVVLLPVATESRSTYTHGYTMYMNEADQILIQVEGCERRKKPVNFSITETTSWTSS